jgi:hypothetical protein
MALGLLYTCRCGTRYKVYVPKFRLFRGLTGTWVDWQAIDNRDEASGDITEVRRLAELTHCSFFDMRQGERLTCGECREETDLLGHFRAVMTELTKRPLYGT